MIISLEFALFTAVSLLIYYLLPSQQNLFLLIASYIFIAAWAWEFALILMLYTAFVYFLAHRLDKFRLWAGIAASIGLLIFFGTQNFFLSRAETLLDSIGLGSETGILKLLVPLGLSYYTLQSISYLLDVHQGLMKPSHEPVNFALYMAYFPKITAGPIERAREFLPRLNESRVVDNAVLSQSFMLIVPGLFRKMVIADSLVTMMPAGLYETPRNFSSVDLSVYLLAYAFALYNDFAGYTEIARGVSGLFGIPLSRNFAYPYFSSSFTEFWTRWHITLSLWLRDYIFLPSTRALLRRNLSRFHPVTIVLPPMATMLASGLWHGMNLHMLMWGGLHGIYLVGERLLSLRRPKDKTVPHWRQGISILIVFILTVLAWVAFRSPGGWIAVQYWQSLFTNLEWATPDIRVFILIAIVLGIDIAQYRDEFVFLRWPRTVQVILLALAILAILLVAGANNSQPFVYQGF